MGLNTKPFFSESDSRFKLFHELMARKVRHILLVSTPYDAWIMEEDCRLSERIVNEYRGLNLSQPPRLTWVSSAEQAIAALDNKPFDLVITMPQLSLPLPPSAPTGLGVMGARVKAASLESSSAGSSPTPRIANSQ